MSDTNETFPCPECGKPTYIEEGVGWWCSNEECELHKDGKDTATTLDQALSDLRAAHEEIARLINKNAFSEKLVLDWKRRHDALRAELQEAEQNRKLQNGKLSATLTRVELLEKDKARLLQIVKAQRDARKNTQRAASRTGE